MGNGTSLVFVTGGIDLAYEMALQAAEGKDVRIGCSSTIEQLTPLFQTLLFIKLI